MNITIISILLPFPLDSGGAQAQYNMIDLLRREHHVTFVFPVNQHNSPKSLVELKRRWPEVTFRPYPLWRQYKNITFAWNKLKRAVGLLCCPEKRSFQVDRILKPYGYDLTADFKEFVRQIVEQEHSDVVQTEFYPYLGLVDCLPPQVHTVFIHHELRFVRNQRMLSPLHPTAAEQQWCERLKEEEISWLNRYDTVVTLTDIDRNVLLENGVTARVEVSPAAINTEIQSYSKWNGSLVFIGGAGHGPNVEGMDWLTQKVFPLLSWNHEGLRFKVIGAGWTAKAIQHVPTDRLDVLGFVHSLKEAAAGGIMLVPILSGSGMRMKILEAAALGMPIITTSVGVEGIRLKHGESCLIADTHEDFANAIKTLLNNADLRKKLADNAQQVFKDNYSKEALAQVRNNIYLSF